MNLFAAPARPLPSVLLPLLWLISLFFSMPLIEPYEISRLASLFAAVAALGVVLLDPATRASHLPRSVLGFLIAGFFFWCGLNYFWSVSPFITLISWGTLALLPLWFLIFALMPLQQAQLKLTLRLAVVAGVGLSFWAFLQYCVFTGFLDKNGTVMHPFADPNNFAAILNLTFFVSLGLLLSTTQRLERYLMLIACAVMLLAMIIIGSRAGLIFTGVALILFLSLTRSAALQLISKRAALIAAMILAFAVIAGLMLAASVEHERVTILSRMGYFLTAQDDSGSIRMMIYASTIDLIKQYFWGGAGLGSFFLLYPAVRAPSEIISAGLMAHNDPLQFWAEAGLPAFILLYAILMVVAWRMISFLRQTLSHNPARIMPTALFCALLTLALHMHVSFHLFVPSLLVATGLILGFWARLTAGNVTKVMPAAPVAVPSFIMATCLLIVMQTCLMSEMHTRQAVEAMEQGDMATFGDKVNQANREGFGLNPRPYILAASIPLGLLQTSPTLSLEEKDAFFEQANNLLEQGLARAPLSAGAYFSKAMLYGAVGRKTEAGEFIDKTLSLDPAHKQAAPFKKR